MAQHNKCSQQTPHSDPRHLPSSIPVPCQTTSTYEQPSMQRHIHHIPLKKDSLPLDEQSALLQAVMQQNALMTELIAAVNGLTALICSRKEL